MSPSKVASPTQCRAARAMLGWTQKKLAELAGVARKTVADFEAGVRPLRLRTRQDITRTLQTAGVRFTSANGGDGVHFHERSLAAPAAAPSNGAATGAVSFSFLERSQP